MMVLVQFALLAFLLFVLVKSSDIFVEAVARIAKYLGVSEFVIGLTVISIGTTLPELGSSTMAAMAGVTELAVGNVVGSVIANIGFILGLSSILVLIKTTKQIFMRDCLVLFSITMVFSIFSYDGTVSLIEGLILLTLAPIYVAYLFRFRPHIRKEVYNFKDYLAKSYKFNHLIHFGAPTKRLEQDLKKEVYEDFVGKGFDLEEYKNVRNRLSRFRTSISKDLTISLFAVVMIYLSARYLIPVAIELAMDLGMGGNVIGATLIAFGTSLPELFVSISSIKKGFSNMLLGNMIGANIFNLTLVAGAAALISPLNIMPTTIAISLPIMILLTGMLFIFARTGWRIKRYEGAALLLVYVAFIYLLLSGGI